MKKAKRTFALSFALVLSLPFVTIAGSAAFSGLDDDGRPQGKHAL